MRVADIHTYILYLWLPVNCEIFEKLYCAADVSNRLKLCTYANSNSDTPFAYTFHAASGLS